MLCLVCYSLGRLCSLVDVVVVRCCALFVTLLGVCVLLPLFEVSRLFVFIGADFFSREQ
jgi:hypothetical protein